MWKKYGKRSKRQKLESKNMKATGLCKTEIKSKE
jgi:hypothetical protein